MKDIFTHPDSNLLPLQARRKAWFLSLFCDVYTVLHIFPFENFYSKYNLGREIQNHIISTNLYTFLICLTTLKLAYAIPKCQQTYYFIFSRSKQHNQFPRRLTHEVEITLPSKTMSEQTDEFMQLNATVYNRRHGSKSAHVGVHLFVHQPKCQRLVPNQCLGTNIMMSACST